MANLSLPNSFLRFLLFFGLWGVGISVKGQTITLAAGSGAASQTVCQATAITSIVYDIAGATNATLTVTPSSPSWATGSLSTLTGLGVGTFTITGNPPSGTYNYIVTVTGLLGGTTTANGTITSKALDWVNLQFPSSGTICVGDNFDVYGRVNEAGVTSGVGQGSNITVERGYSATNTNPSTWTNWQSASYNSLGSTGNDDEYKATLSGLAAGDYYYTFRYKLDNCEWQYGGYNSGGGGFWNAIFGSSPSTNNVSGKLTVLPLPTASISILNATSPLTVCANTLTKIVFTNPHPSLPITVTYSMNNGTTTTNQTISVAANDTTQYIVPTNIGGTFAYSLVSIAYQSPNPSCVNTTVSGSVVVKVNEVKGGNISANQTICVGGDPANFTSASVPSATFTGAGWTGPTYKWQKNTTSCTSTFSDISGAIIATFNEVPITQTTYYRRVATYALASLNLTCSAPSDTCVKVTVVADPSAPTATQSPNVTTVCVGASLSLINPSIVGGTGTCNIQYSTNGTSWSSTSPTVLTSNNTISPVVIQIRTNCGGLGCDISPVTSYSWTVVADPTLSAPTVSQTICKGGTATLTSTASNGTGVFHYQWEYFTPGTPTGTWASVGSGTPTGISYTADTTTSLSVTGNGSEAAASKSYRLQLMSLPLTTGCTATSSTGKVVTVDDINITGQPISPAEICVGGTSGNMSVTATGGTPTPLSYQWRYLNGAIWQDVQSGVPTGAIYTNATSASNFSVAGISAPGAYLYHCVVSTTGSGCGPATSDDVTVTVKPDPSLTLSATYPHLCNGGSTPITATIASGTGVSGVDYTYSWTNNINTTVSSSTASYGTQTYSTMPPLATINTYNYTLTMSSVSASLGCSGSKTVAIVVHPDPTISSFTVNLTSGQVCSGGTYTLTGGVSSIPNFGTQPTYTYSWKEGAPTSNWVIGSTSNDTSYTHTNITTLVDTYNYYVKVNNPQGCDAVSSSTSPLTVNVYQDPKASISGGNTICDGGKDTLITTIIQSGVGTTSYSWQRISPAPSTLGSNAPTLSLSNLTATSVYQLIFDTDGVGCDPHTTNKDTVTVVPDPTINLTTNPISKEVCSGGQYTSTATILPINNIVAPYTYSWKENNGLWTIGSNSQSYTNTVAGTYTDFVKISNSQGCNAIDSVQIEVKLDPQATISGGNTICTGGNDTLAINISQAGTGNKNYTWQKSAWTTVGTNNDTLLIANLQQTTTYRLIFDTDGVGCDADTTNTNIVTVVPDPTITITDDSTVCVGADVTFISLIGEDGEGTLTYSWQVSNLNPSNWTGVGSGNPNLALTNVASTKKYRLLFSASASGCDTYTSNVDTLTVVPDPTVAITPKDTLTHVCKEGLLTLLSSGVTNGSTGAFTYQWQQLNAGTWGAAFGTNTNYASYTVQTGTVQTKQYRLQVASSANGCDTYQSSPINTQIHPEPHATTLLTDSFSVCSRAQPTSITSTLGSTGLPYGYSIKWYESDAGSAYSVVRTDVPVVTATYSPIAKTVIDDSPKNLRKYYTEYIYTNPALSCDTDTSEHMKVEVRPEPQTPTIPNLTPVCDGAQGIHLSFVDNTSQPYNYTWSALATGDSLYHGGAEDSCILVSLSPNQTHNFNVQITNPANCSINKAFTITTNGTPNFPVPDTVPIIKVNDNTLVCAYNTFATYQWGYDDIASYCGGSQLNGETYQSYYEADGLDTQTKYYWVQVNMQNNEACNTRYYYNGPLGYSGKYVYEDLEVADNLQLSPNPTSEELYIRLSNAETGTYTFRLVNALGQVVREESLYKKANLLEWRGNINEYASGVYMVVMTNVEGKMYMQKLIID